MYLSIRRRRVDAGEMEGWITALICRPLDGGSLLGL